MRELLGLPLQTALEKLEGRKAEVVCTLPPRHPEKTGTMRVVRVTEIGETVRITVSPFHDTPKGENDG